MIKLYIRNIFSTHVLLKLEKQHEKFGLSKITNSNNHFNKLCSILNYINLLLKEARFDGESSILMNPEIFFTNSSNINRELPSSGAPNDE